MDEERLRQQAEKDLDWKISDQVWSLAEQEDLVRLAIVLGEERYQELLDYLREVLSLDNRARPGGRPRNSDTVEFQVTLRPEEEERRAALAEYQSKIAEGWDGVRRFRETVLGGSPLSVADARRFLTTPANQWLDLDHFDGIKSPFIREYTKNVEWEFDSDSEGVVVHLPQPFGLQRLVMDRQSFRAQHRVLHYPGEDGKLKSVPYWPGSILGQLDELVPPLVVFLQCQDWEAAWFVLTNQPPNFHVFRIVDEEPTRWPGRTLRIEVASWISPETLASNYRQAQRQLRDGRSHRTLSLMMLKLFRFVVGRSSYDIEPGPTSERGGMLIMENGTLKRTGPTYESLAHQWNRCLPDDYPEWYEAKRRKNPKWSGISATNLGGDYKEVADRMIPTAYW